MSVEFPEVDDPVELLVEPTPGRFTLRSGIITAINPAPPNLLTIRVGHHGETYTGISQTPIAGHTYLDGR